MKREDASKHLAAYLQAMGLRLPEGELATCAERTAELVASRIRSLHEPLPTVSTFPAPASGGAVKVEDVGFYSLCAHHLVPFFGTVELLYVPSERVIGFGGIARAVDYFSRRPQLQEGFTEELAGFFDSLVSPLGLEVRVCARQLCVELHGHGTQTRYTTTARRGEL